MSDFAYVFEKGMIVICECSTILIATFGSFTICRARQNHRHKGNQRFRQLVEFSTPLYVAAKTKLDKTSVIQKVVEKVRRDSVGGGFVKKDFHSGLWFEIGDDKGALKRPVADLIQASPDRCLLCVVFVNPASMW
jgi:hypothetical protein